MKGQAVSPRKELLYYYQANDLNAIRVGNYKLVFPHNFSSVKIPGHDGSSGAVENKHTDLQLFDLSKDPGEQKDIKDQFPDIVTQLQIEADIARKDLGDKLTNTIGANVRRPGMIQ